MTNFINFHSAGEIAKVVSGTPTYNYMVTFYGNVKVTTGGKYQFCTTSSDGSYLYVGSISHMVVNNGPGRHGVKQVCNYETLKSGNTYHIIVKMFKGGSGGSTIQVPPCLHPAHPVRRFADAHASLSCRILRAQC